MNTPDVAIAFSGGKDSTAAILLLREQGFTPLALHMELGLTGDPQKLERIRHLARTIAVPFELIDLSRQFRETVIDHFIATYRAGRTPNPCVLCNRRFKFKVLLEAAKKMGLPQLASGHYAARVEEKGHWFLTEPADRRKSRIYFLAMIEPASLASIRFPIGPHTIDAIRAKTAGLPLGNSKESQDVCFLQNLALPEFMQREVPEGFIPGDILDPDGQVIGRHDGILRYTIGQRRGTRFASDRRLYVTAIDAAANTITLGDEPHLLRNTIHAITPNYWRPLVVGEELAVKIRYVTRPERAVITSASPDAISARLLHPLRAVTPGQFAVFYHHDRIVAAGEIG